MHLTGQNTSLNMNTVFFVSKMPAEFINTKCQQMIDKAKTIADAQAINSVQHLNTAAR